MKLSINLFRKCSLSSPLLNSRRLSLYSLRYYQRIGHPVNLLAEKELSTFDENEQHLVFVYGTLKKNEPNYDIISNPAEGTATYIGLGRTVKKWPLVIASRYNIPFLLYNEGKGKNVIGELYKVDNKMLANMDKLECHPTYYTRIMTDVELLPENSESSLVILKPWIYFLKRYREHLLELPFIENYSSKGSHGLEYVSRYNRPTAEDYITDVKD